MSICRTRLSLEALPIALLALLLLAVGCNDEQLVQPPSALRYATTAATYTRDMVIARNVPTVTGEVATWAVSPVLPEGLALDPLTGEIAGTPTVVQTARTYTVTASNPGGWTTAQVQIVVNDAAPMALSYGTAAAVYTRDVAIVPNLPTVTGSVSAWAVEPPLPAGLTLDAAGGIRGTPTTLQAATTYTVTATNITGSTTAELSITVNDAAPLALSYETTAAVYTLGATILPNVPTVTGSVVSWSVDPALPAGLVLDDVTGTISGTPTVQQATTTYTVVAANSGGLVTAQLSITVNHAAPTALSYATTAVVYTVDEVSAPNVPTVTGTVITWSVAPALPAGLILDTSTGVIAGTPTTQQAATEYVVTATNTGGFTATTLSITVNDAAPLALSYTTTAAIYTRDVVIAVNQPSITGTVRSWSVAPALPAGLILDTTTGEISGTPSTLQAATSYVVTASNTGGSTTATLQITVNDAAPTALSYATTSATYTKDVVITTNVPTVTGSVVTWSVSPALPAGLILDTTTGEISGTPSTLQTVSSYVVTATNTGGSATATISITVNAAAPTGLSYETTSAVYTLDAPITANTPTVTGSVVSWAVSPALPSGLVLDTATGVISGTPTALRAVASYVITASNTGGSTTATISITVNDAAPTALSYATTAAVYTRDAVISSNQPTVTGTVRAWSVSPALPAGLALDTTTGVISGTPTALQTATSYVVTASNTGGSTTATVSITVNDAAPTALSYATSNAVYTRDMVISANSPTVTGSVVHWSVSPALPTGLTLNTTTGVISGTPTTLQAATSYVVTASNTGGSTTAAISITVNDAAPTALSYTTTSAVYTRGAVIANNTPTVTGTVVSWSVSPALPTGLTLNTSTGVISGTPTTLQAATSYVVTASNSGGSTTATLSITINDAAPTALSYGTTSAVYTQNSPIAANVPTVTGTVTTWSVSPALPAGLTLDTTTGRITGTPSAVQGATSYVVTASNSGGQATATISITVNNDPPSALSYSTATAVYTRDVVITANVPTVTGTVTTWSVVPTLPNGLVLESTGRITGAPSAVQAATSYTITASNSGGSTTASISIRVTDAAPTNLSYSTPSATYTRGAVITANTPTVTGSVVSWSVNPALPTGLTLDTTSGHITGTPSAVQSAASYTVTATNSGGSTTASITITVNDASPTNLSYSTPSATYPRGQTITANTPTVTGSVVTWAVDPALPAGLTLNTSTGVITGSPSTVQTAVTYTVTASNSGGSTTAPVSIAVEEPAAPVIAHAITCTFSTVDSTGDCSVSSAGTGVTTADNHTRFGGQNVNVVIHPSNVGYDAIAETFSFSMAIENMLEQTIGTIDNVTPSTTGIRLVVDHSTVVSGSGHSIAVMNADAVGDYASPNVPYFQYNEILAQGATSADRQINLHVPPTVTTFTTTFEISTKVQAMVVINEVMVNPLNPLMDAYAEWFELTNTGKFPVNMVGFYIGDSAASGDRPAHLVTTPSNTLWLAPDAYLVFGNSADTSRNGGVTLDYAYGANGMAPLALANSLDAVRVISPDGYAGVGGSDGPAPDVQTNPANVEIDRVVYKSAAISAQDGIARELKNPRLDNRNMDGSNWCDAAAAAVFGPGGRGTPGAANSCYTP